MNLSRKVHLIIYRFREKGLEVFLMNKADNGLSIPSSAGKNDQDNIWEDADRLITLDPVEQENGQTEEAFAVEGEYHDIPSLKKMLLEDAQFVKDQFVSMESGTFISVKEAFKKVLPHQYQFLKELKDILTDRNSVKDL
ncbi:MAG: hypothetical protein HRU40_20205 [Saprospiraceae bacterium]|nr:hypothetical protein [Saprospiraceae bacterium]